MSKLKIRAFAGVTLALAVASGAVAAQGWRPPAESQRCPSKWGAGDERGAGNHMKPEAVLRATRLIRTGEVIELGHVLGAGMPMNPARVFNLSNPGLGSLLPNGSPNRIRFCSAPIPPWWKCRRTRMRNSRCPCTRSRWW